LLLFLRKGTLNSKNVDVQVRGQQIGVQAVSLTLF
jgi:hypothetical protein